MFTLLLLLIIFVVVALRFNEGLWSNALMLINVLLAMLVATCFFEPLARFLESKEASYTYIWDFLSIWLIFAAALIVIRIFTDKISKVQVKFRRPLDLGGSIFFALWIGYLMLSFALFSLHTAPLAKHFMDGSFQEQDDTHMFLGLGPDRKWMAFVHKLSKEGSLKRNPTPNVFDPNAEFVLKYGDRRAAFEKLEGDRVNPNAK